MELSTLIVLATITLLLAWFRSHLEWKARTRGRPLPPGPPRLPIVGNLFNVPRVKSWLGYRDLATRLGGILHVRIFGHSTIILSNPDAVLELLEKRSANSSDRTQSPVAELIGQEASFVLFPYGTWWRRHRREFWQHFYKTSIESYRPIQEAYTRGFMLKLLRDPLQFKQHIRYAFMGTMLKVIYGIDISEGDDDYYRNIDLALEGGSQGLVAGRWWVEFIPLLRHVPVWFPGAGFQKLFAVWRGAARFLKDVPFSLTKSAIDDGTSPNCIVRQLITRVSEDESSEDAGQTKEQLIKNVAFTALEAGGDTTFSTLQTMLLGLSLHPEIQAKAHAELDAVVGPNRLPDFNDWDSLVYVNAIIKESLRWQNVLPLGLPHRTLEDDEFGGYFIPAGTDLTVNVWACLHDPEAYDAPDEFRPERFIRDGKLDPTVRDPSAFAFGFGRRICPGRHFAEAALFINAASVLHVFDITPPLDENGDTIKIAPQMSDGLISYPEDCRCTIKPRSQQAEALVINAQNDS